MSDEEYTPTTDEVRSRYQAGSRNEFGHRDPKRVTDVEFDRWLMSVRRDEREKCAQIAESRHKVPVSANTAGDVTYQETARFPDDGRRIAAAIRAQSEEATRG